jgi:hypothetical protein
MAKRFFYVCSGLFLLVLSFQLGARAAVGQTSNLLLVGDVSAGACGVTESRQFYAMHDRQFGGQVDMWAAPIPGTSRVVGAFVGSEPSSSGHVVLENGDVYWAFATTTPWQYAGNLFSAGPTSISPSSWGQVKDRYRK